MKRWVIVPSCFIVLLGFRTAFAAGPWTINGRSLLGNSGGYQAPLVGANSIIDANPGTYKYPSLDFSGIDLKVGLNIYLP